MAIGGEDDVEIVEAKSSTSRVSVRTAIGQLFDYCRHIPGACAMTMLLPEAPDPALEALCLGVGITVVYPNDTGVFERHEPTAEARATILTLLRPIH
jgi:hypothetical protein